MKNYLDRKESYNIKFADAIMTKFLSLRYGISPCTKTDIDLAIMRKELVDWQSSYDYCALSEVRINYKAWLPVHMYNDENPNLHADGCACGSCGVGGPVTCNSASMQYNNGSDAENIIDINAGGCLTRIVVNPTININNGTGAKSFQITTPQAVWYFIHNLGFNPNVLTTDSNGQQIDGTVTYIDVNTIEITFSSPVSGWAYLS